MASQLKLRRGTTTQHSTFTGASGEVTVDTTKKTLVVHDGTTAGGVPLATAADVAAKQNADSELTTLAGMSASRAAFLASDQGFGFRNRIINGAMVIDQRGSAAAPSTTGGFGPDRFNNATAVSATSWGQVTDGPSSVGLSYSGRITVTSATTCTAAQYVMVRQIIEGNNIADLAWGTATASAITLSFWVKSSLTGTFCVGLINSAEDRSYVANYTINTANTWEYKTIVVPGDTTGTWLTNNSNGIRVAFDLGSGSNYIGTANTWQSGWKQRTSGSVNVVGTLNATWQVTGVQLEKGSTATSFDYRPYGTELQLCQRYYYRNTNTGNITSSLGFGVSVSTTLSDIQLNFPVTMRSSPTFNYGGSPIVTDSIGYNLAVSSISSQYTNSQAARVFLSHVATATVRSPATLSAVHASSAYVELTSEL